MVFPNFIIPGAQKSGTTALRIYLNQHPDIFIADKEVHYFDRDINYQKGHVWYKQHFKNWKDERAIGEKTPDYLYFKKVPERIYKLLPDVKLIFVFRNPVDRAYSHYWHKIRKDEEDRNFEQSVLKINGVKYDSEYIILGRYIEQVKLYSSFFPKSNMLFLLAEDLKQNTEKILSVVLNFLEVNTDIEFKDLQKKHIGGIPRTKFLLKLAYSNYLKEAGVFRDILLRLNTKKGFFPSIKPKLRFDLEKYFEPYNIELKEFTGLNIDKWRNSFNG